MADRQERFDVYQNMNPDSIHLLPGGEWTDGAIISGSIVTISKSAISQGIDEISALCSQKTFHPCASVLGWP